MKRVALMLACTALLGAAPTAEYDVVLVGGTVLDGSGGVPLRADVGITGAYVTAIGDLSRATARTRFDASGLYVTPGFVSVHDHSEAGQHARPIGLVSQGITTAIGNPDGFGPTDILAPLAGVGPGINYGAYIGFNSVWNAVVGNQDRRATPAEIVRMRRLVTQGMTDGAFGVSAGLDYKPGFFATTDEVIAVVSAARAWRTGFPNHDRLYAGNGFSSLAGQDETIRIGATAGLMPIVTHMHMLSRDQGKSAAAFRRFAGWRRSGIAVGVDAYPYTYAATALEQILIPAWAQAGGRAAMLARFADPAARARIVTETDATIADRVRGPANLRLPGLRRELTDIAAQWRVGPGEAIVRLLEQGQTDVIIRSVTEADRTRILRDPVTAISCDCGAIASTTGHPRNWGAYPRFFGLYVRERGIVSWAEGVRRATALPAAMIGLVDRGWLRPGMVADVAVFDPRTIADRATLEAPTLISTGIGAVLVNGRFAWSDRRFTPRAGLVLRRARYAPTREMIPGVRHGVDATLVTQTGVRVAISARMAPGAMPVGRATVDGLPGGRFVIDRPGLLQTAPGWAALTGIGRDPGGRRHPATLTIDRSGPPHVVLTVDGVPVLDAPVTAGTPMTTRRF